MVYISTFMCYYVFGEDWELIKNTSKNLDILYIINYFLTIFLSVFNQLFHFGSW